MTATTPLGIQVAQRAVTGASEPWGEAQLESLPQGDLVAAHRDLAEARRRLDAEFAAASAEIGRRSDPADGPAGLARRHGFATPQKMVAAVTGGSSGEAGRLISVGKITQNAKEVVTDHSAGSTAPAPRFPVLAAAIKAGKISVDAAGAIGAMLERIAPRVVSDAADAEAGRETLARAEAHLVERAQHLPFAKLGAVIRQCEARFDLERYESEEEVRRGARYLNIFESQQTGMVTVDGRLDAESAAPLRAAIDAMVADFLRRKRDAEAQPGTMPGGIDDRNVPQVRADALADLARHCLSCDTDDLPLTSTTVVVRVGLEELRSGVGLGEIDGCDQPMSITAIRRMAADAGVIPYVMGGEGDVLEYARTRRLFSRGQRRAMVERDGGCSACHAPPSYAQGHHIAWWDRDGGTTDLKNGVLLCASCHHRIHRDNWGIDVNDSGVWFIPPPEVDRQRKPVRGGRAQYEYTEQNHQQVCQPLVDAA